MRIAFDEIEEIEGFEDDEQQQPQPIARPPTIPDDFESRLQRVEQRMADEGYPIMRTSGRRTAEEQQALYDQGRVTPGRIVTNADGTIKRSAHQDARATDFAFDVDGKPSWAEGHRWDRLGEIAQEEGLEWGGNYQSLVDRPHVQMPGPAPKREKFMLSEVEEIEETPQAPQGQPRPKPAGKTEKFMLSEIEEILPASPEAFEGLTREQAARAGAATIRSQQSKYKYAEPQKPPPTFGEALGGGVDVLQQLGYSAAEWAGEAMGSDTLAQWGAEGRKRNVEELKKAGPKQSVYEIKSFGDFEQWVKQTVGEQIPMMAPAMAGGAAGAAVGSLAGPIGTTVGGVIGAFVPSLVLGVGEVQSGIKERDPNAVAPGYVFAGGSAIAALDTALPGKIGSQLVRKLGWKAANEVAERALMKPVKQGFVRRTAKGAAEGLATEGVTEALQEAIGEVAVARATGTAIDPKLMARMGEAGAAGALMGALAAGPTAAIPERPAAPGGPPAPPGAPPAAPAGEAVIPPPPPPGAAPAGEVAVVPPSGPPGAAPAGGVRLRDAEPTNVQPWEADGLRTLGWNNEQISGMTPEQVTQILKTKQKPGWPPTESDRVTGMQEYVDRIKEIDRQRGDIEAARAAEAEGRQPVPRTEEEARAAEVDAAATEMEDRGLAGMTGERVRQRYGMEPAEAVKAGLVRKEEQEGRIRYRVERPIKDVTPRPTPAQRRGALITQIRRPPTPPAAPTEEVPRGTEEPTEPEPTKPEAPPAPTMTLEDLPEERRAAAKRLHELHDQPYEEIAAMSAEELDRRHRQAEFDASLNEELYELKADEPTPKFADLPTLERKEIRRAIEELAEVPFEKRGAEDVYIPPGQDPETYADERQKREGNLIKHRPNAPVYHAINRGKRRTSRHIQYVAQRWIAGKGRGGGVVRDLIRVARVRAYGDPRAYGAVLMPEAGEVEGEVYPRLRMRGTPEAAAERAVTTRIEAEREQLETEYEKRHGTVFNTEKMQEVLGGGPTTRAAASAFTQDLFHKALNGPLTTQNDVVRMTAGGPGSGKTTYLHDVHPKQIVLDSVMADFPRALRNIRFALDTGHAVQIDFLWVDPVEAWRRNKEDIDIQTFAELHFRAPRTLLKVMDEFADEFKVSPNIRDNQEFEDRDADWLRTQIEAYDDADAIRRAIEADRGGPEARPEELPAGRPRPSDEVAERGEGEGVLRPEARREEAPTRVEEPTPPKVEEKPKFEATLWQGRGATPEQIYGPENVARGTAVPIMGQAQYYAFTPDAAKIYGAPKQYKVSLKNPLTISTGRQWYALLQDAKALHLSSVSEEHFRDPGGIPAATKRLQKYLRDQGYDGVIVKWTEDEKRLRESFGHPQVIVFEKAPIAAEEEKPAAKPPEPTPAPKPKEVDKRADMIDAILEAARRPMDEIVEAFDIKGTDGKWYTAEALNNMPIGVRPVEPMERRSRGWILRSPTGTYGGVLTKTREEQLAKQEAVRDKDAAEFREHLLAASDADLQRQYDFWVRDKGKMGPPQVSPREAKIRKTIEGTKQSYHQKLAQLKRYGLSDADAKARLAGQEAAGTEEQRSRITPMPTDKGTVSINYKTGNLEIAFPVKPVQKTIDLLKQQGFKWSKGDKVWYGPDSGKTRTAIEDIATWPGPETPATPSVPAEPEAEPGRTKFASTQVNLPANVSMAVMDVADTVAEEDLAEGGREAVPHITVKYGIHSDDVAQIREVLKGEHPVTVQFGQTNYFEGKDADVLHVTIKSSDLNRLNAKIAKAVQVTDTFPDYKPHATVAYLKPGLGPKYAGDPHALEGTVTTIDEITFHPVDGPPVTIPLTGKRPTPAARRKNVMDSLRPPTRLEQREELTVDTLEEMATDEAMGVTYDEEEQSYLPSGESAINCTACGERIIEMVGRGELYGWEEGTNPTSIVAGPEKGARLDEGQGHDFAVIDGRFLVDAWAKNVEGSSKRAAFDLFDIADRTEVARLYGDPSKWVRRVFNEKTGEYKWVKGQPDPLRDVLRQDPEQLDPDTLGKISEIVETYIEEGHETLPAIQRAFDKEFGEGSAEYYPYIQAAWRAQREKAPTDFVRDIIRPNQPTPTPTPTPAPDAFGEETVGFGRYATTKIKDLAREQPGYARWLYENGTTPRALLIKEYLGKDKQFMGAGQRDAQAATRVVTAEVQAVLAKFGVEAKPMADGTVQLSGRTYDWRKEIKERGGRWDGATQSWKLTPDSVAGLVDVFRRTPATRVGRRLPEAAYKSDPRLGRLRDAATNRPDIGQFVEPVESFVRTDTQDLIRKGLALGMPPVVVDEQIEDIARINRGYQRNNRLFILASEPGSGKTYVLGGAIRELRRAGAKKITYVTLRQELITQIKKDLADYDIGDVNFITYPMLRKTDPVASDVLIFDEAHAIKNIATTVGKITQGSAAAGWIGESKFTVISSATPFENPIEAAYLEPTGVFNDTFGGFDDFALAFGASKMTIGEGEDQTVLLTWRRTTSSDDDARAARDWFMRSGVYTSRRIRLPENQVDSRLVKVSAPPEAAERYAKFTEAAADNDDKLGGFARAWIINFQKRLLEASKVNKAIEEAAEARSRGRFPIIFVETKAERKLDIPDLMEKEQEWQMAVAMALRMRDRPPPRKDFGLPPQGIVDVLATYMDRSGESIITIPSAEDLILEKFPDAAIFTGSVSPAQAQKNLDAWRRGEKPFIVATMAKGGTGLSLHDKVGDHQTTQINLNLPWKATGVVQVAQRSARYGLRGKAEMEWIFADNIPFDRKLARKVGGRMADMGALVHGERLPGSAEIEDWNFEDLSFGEQADINEPKKLSQEEESDQERSHREWRENADRVAQDPEAASNTDLLRAIGYLTHKRPSYYRPGSDALARSIDTEIGYYKAIIEGRRIGKRKQEPPRARGPLPKLDHPALKFTRQVLQNALNRGDENYASHVLDFLRALENEEGPVGTAQATYSMPGLEGSRMFWYNPATGKPTGMVEFVRNIDADPSAGRYYAARLVEKYGEDHYRDSRFEEPMDQHEDGTVTLVFTADWNYLGLPPNRARTIAEAPADILPTGEEQPRLPGRVGEVRDQEVAHPELVAAGNVRTPYSVSAMEAIFGLKSWEAAAADALIKHMGLNTDRVSFAIGDADQGSLFQAEEPARKLSVLHNLSSENLEFADKMGGLAVPSMALLRDDMSLEGYGDITLIGRKDLGDPAKVEVFDADIYSTRFPKPEYPKARSAVAQKVLDALKPFAKKFDARTLQYELWDNAVNYPKPEETISRMLRTQGSDANAAQAWFLKERYDIDVEPVMEPREPREGWNWEKPWVDFVKKNDINDRSDEFFKGAGDAITASIESYLEKKYSGDKELTQDMREFLRDTILKRFVDPETGRAHFGPLHHAWDDVKNIGTDRIDSSATDKKITEQVLIKGRTPEFYQWARDKILGMHGDPFLRIGRQRVPFTLENAVDVMTGKKVQAAERTLTFGEGMARAAAAKRITSLQEARNRAEYQIAPRELVDEDRTGAKAAIEKWRNQVVPYRRYYASNAVGATWEGLDASMRAMARWAKNRQSRGSRVAMRRALAAEDFVNVPEWLVEEGIEAGKLFLEAHVPYFEVKPHRAVKLNEFAGAVIVEGTPPHITAILDKHGIPYRTYGLPFDEVGRRTVVNAFRQELAEKGENVLFMGTKAAVEFAQDGTAIIRALNKPDISSVLHEFAHVARRQLFDRRLPPEERAGITEEDIRTAEEWSGAIDGVWDRKAEEKFARGFERYLRDGQAPTPKLQSLFFKIAKWLSNIYTTLKGSSLDVDISPAMRQVFDRLVTRTARIEAQRIANTTKKIERVEKPKPQSLFDEQERLFQRAAPLDSPQFRRWFGDSKIVNEDGTPKVVYHGTMQDFDEFKKTRDIGFHFGTKAQANAFVSESALPSEADPAPEWRIGRIADWQGGRIMPVYLKMENPLRLPDLGTWAPSSLLKALETAGVIEDTEYDEVYEASMSVRFTEGQYRSMIQDLLQQKGYDGIVYMNRAEGLDRVRAMPTDIREEKSKDFADGVRLVSDQYGELADAATREAAWDRARTRVKYGSIVKGEDSYIVFSPTQVKSAIGNIGTFSPTSPSILTQRAAPLDSKEFRNWFKDSKAVDAKGRPLVAYHGTSADFTVFRIFQKGRVSKNRDWMGRLGAFFTAPSESMFYEEGNAEFMASDFAGATGEGAPAVPGDPRTGARVMPVYLSIQKPMEYEGFEDLLGHAEEKKGPAGLRRHLLDEGFDGIVVRASDTDGNVERDDWVAFFPNQIKSATGNVGTYDPTNPDILYQEEELPKRTVALVRQYVDADLSLQEAIDQFHRDLGTVDARAMRRIFEISWESLTGEQPPSRVGNINLEKFPLSNDQKRELALIIEQNDEFITQRRGVRSWGTTHAAAEATELVKRLPTAGTAFNAEQLEALAGHIITTREQLDAITDRVAEGKADQNLLIRQAQLIGQEQLLLETYAGTVAEAGRALNILRKIREGIQTENFKLLEAAIDILGGRDGLQAIAERLRLFGNDDIGKYGFIRSLQRVTVVDWLNWYWYTNLLSGPLTHARNLTGNSSQLIYKGLALPASAGIDTFRAAMTGTPRSIRLNEIAMQWAGLQKGASEGLKKAAFLMRHGFTLDDVASMEIRPPEVPGGIYTNFIGRALESADLVFRSMHAMAELYGQAYTQAQNKGLMPGTAEGDRFIAKFIQEPPVAVLKAVQREAARMVFRGEPGPFMRGLMMLRDDFNLPLPNGKRMKIWNPAKFFIPFVQTPANIMKMSLEATPIGFAMAPFRETSRERAETAGRALLGTALLTPLAMLVAQGMVSGSGPDDKEQRDQLYRMGWQPNSIRIGGTWYGYSNFQPLALPLSILANAFESWTYSGKVPSMGTILAKTARSVLQQSYLSGLSSLQDAIEQPERWGQALVQKIATSLVPLSSLRGQIARAVDPVVRQPETIGEAVMAGQPGLSTGVRPRYTAFGEEAVRGGNVLTRLFSPVTVSKLKDTPLEQELYRLRNDIQVGFPGNTVTIRGRSIRMTPDEYDYMLRESGMRIKAELEGRTEPGSAWMDRDDDRKVQDIKRIVDEQRERVRRVVVRRVRDRVAAEPAEVGR